MNIDFVYALLQMVLEFPEKKEIIRTLIENEMISVFGPRQPIPDFRVLPIELEIAMGKYAILGASTAMGKIDAIKNYRNRTELGLKASKMVIDECIDLGRCLSHDEAKKIADSAY